MAPVLLASQLATGLGVLAGAMLVKSAMEQQQQQPMAGGWRSPRCPSCNGTGRVDCLCSRWSDGDSGCRTCAGSGRMGCSSCGGSGTGRPLPIQISKTAQVWTSPPSHCLTFNVDAGKDLLDNAAIGGVLRDEYGQWKVGFQQCLQPISVLEAEIQAIKMALTIMQQLNIAHVCVESDSSQAVKLITTHYMIPHPFSAIIRDCRLLLNGLHGTQIQHISRAQNRAAHHLTNLAKHGDVFLHILYKPPDELCTILQQDAACCN